jgi:hypothetical protein
MSWRSSHTALDYWIEQRQEAWSKYFEALELAEVANTQPSRRKATMQKQEASRRAQYFDLLIAAAIDPCFNRRFANEYIREGVEL